MVTVPVFYAADFDTYDSGLFAVLPDGTIRTLSPIAPEDERTALFPIQNVVSFGDRLVFVGLTAETGNELFWVDGQSNGFNLLAEINFGATGSAVRNLVIAGNKLFFVADDPVAGRELRVLNGDTATLVKDLLPGAGNGLPGGVNHVVALGDKVIFRGVETATGAEPYVSDGTAAGTFRLADILGGASGSNPVFFENGVLGNHLYFAASTSTNGMALYRTDGTMPGTLLVRNFPAGTDDPPVEIQDVTVSDGKVFFAANDGLNGRELWVHDPVTGATELTKDIGGPSESGNPDDLVAFRDGVLFTAQTSATGRELWFSDGTDAGTLLIADIHAGSTGSNPREVTVFGDRAIFTARSSGDNFELWITDGTLSGTSLLKEINPGTAGSSPSNFQVVGDKVYFASGATGTGREIWVTDGTTAGTMLVDDFFPGDIPIIWRAMGLLDINFYTPGQITLSGGSVRENRAAGAVVGRLSATDQDGDALTYSLVSNPGNLFRIVGNELRTNAALDFETARSHTLTVRVSDGELSSQRNLTINVLNDTTDDRSVIVGTAGPDRLVGGARPDLIRGLGGNDTLIGRGGNDTLLGAAGSDQVRGGAGGDVLRGGAGADRLGGGAGIDRLIGGGGNDALLGGAGNDRMLGGAGRDRLDGGRGNDALAGGRGADTFVFKKGYGTDRVTDFSASQGDRLELSSALWTGELTADEVIDRFGATHRGLQALRFGEDVLVFEGISDLSTLAARIDIL